jgi:hypothetical protein
VSDRLAARDLLETIARVPVVERDAWIERHLGLGEAPSKPPGDDLVGYHASGVAPIVHMLHAVPVVPADVLVDLGSGLGKVVLLARMLTGATVRGVELQASLVERARTTAKRIGIDVRFDHADVRDAALDDGTVFFLYVPFTGAVLGRVLERLHEVARRHAIVVCALGVDLAAPWLAQRPLDAFWLSLYDSVVEGVPARAPCSSCLGEPAEIVVRGAPPDAPATPPKRRETAR